MFRGSLGVETIKKSHEKDHHHHDLSSAPQAHQEKGIMVIITRDIRQVK